MADTFEEMVEEYHKNENNAGIEAGDTCPEDCSETLHELHHPRDAQIDTPRHEEAPETEVVCIHHGILESF